jgi:hypothetical protein
MTIPAEVDERVAAEQWFLWHGLPSVLTQRARWRRLWWRSAPALVALTTVFVAIRIITLASGGREIDIDAHPTPAEWLILTVLLGVAPVALGAAALASRVASQRGRSLIVAVSLIVCALVDVVSSEPLSILPDLVSTAVAVALVLAAIGLGIGSVVGWSIRLTLAHLKSAGVLFTRALPVLLLTVLVFFNGPVWSMATTISRGRMWLLIGFMLAIACAFLCTGVVERVRPTLTSPVVRDEDIKQLQDTPFGSMPDPGNGDHLTTPLSRGERVNVTFVVAVSQFVQIAAVALVTSVIFLIMGMVALTPQLLARLTVNGDPQGTWLGMVLPVPQALIHVAMFLGALTFMYVSARSVGDGEYRSRFLDPLIDDVRVVLLARGRYRAYVARSHRT